MTILIRPHPLSLSHSIHTHTHTHALLHTCVILRISHGCTHTRTGTYACIRVGCCVLLIAGDVLLLIL